MSELHEIAFTRDEVAEILRLCDGKALLVGGQALAFWAQRYEVEPPDVLITHITRDADFLGGRDVARSMVRQLDGWDIYEPGFDDVTSQTAKLAKTVGLGVKQIDFMANIVGLDNSKISKRAPVIELEDGTSLSILHPIDVLASRFHNLASLPSKRTPEGIAQAQLAISVAREFLQDSRSVGTQKDMLGWVEDVIELAQNKRLEMVASKYNISLLAAIPLQAIESPEFHSRRWPQVLKYAEERARLMEKRKARAKSEPLDPDEPAETPAP